MCQISHALKLISKPVKAFDLQMKSKLPTNQRTITGTGPQSYYIILRTEYCTGLKLSKPLKYLTNRNGNN